MDEFVTSQDNEGNTYHFKRGMMEIFRLPRVRFRLFWREDEWWIVGVRDDGSLNIEAIERLTVWIIYKGMVHPAHFFPDGKGGFRSEPLYLGCLIDGCSWPKCHLRQVALPPCPIL